MTTALLTFLALIAFAANSILARLALGEAAIDPASYTAVRLSTGAATLWLVSRFRQDEEPAACYRRMSAAAMLFLYAAAFSFAYLSLSAGTGALILFAAVQITMVGAGLCFGERPSGRQWLGLSVAVAGLVYLVFPGIAAPSPVGSLLMGTAGVAWGVYSILGQGTADPVRATARNFSGTLFLIPIVLAFSLPSLALTAEGFLWAALSGAITSALGYVAWYAALRGLTATLAAAVQLSVPALAAFGGVLFLSEQITLRLILGGAVILTGVALAVFDRQK